MKYAQWTIKRPEGTTPEPTIRENGGTASGGIMLNNETVLGYVSDDATTTGLTEWNFTIKTAEQALALAQARNAECFFADDGTIKAPEPELS